MQIKVQKKEKFAIYFADWVQSFGEGCQGLRV